MFIGVEQMQRTEHFDRWRAQELIAKRQRRRR
jgi:hypothetical protein